MRIFDCRRCGEVPASDVTFCKEETQIATYAVEVVYTDEETEYAQINVEHIDDEATGHNIQEYFRCDGCGSVVDMEVEYDLEGVN